MPDTLLIIFGAIIAGFLIIDLAYFNRQAHRIGYKSALIQSIFWIVLSLFFAFLVLGYMGREAAMQFLSAYVTEKMLSMDNLFVFLLIFSFFKIEEQYYHRVLFWGILGAILFRASFVLTGTIMVSKFHWILYVFGMILIYTGIRLFGNKKEVYVDFRHNKIFKLANKYLPFSSNHHGGKFIVFENGKFCFTLLTMVIILVETTDIVFAIDSIPAALAISQNPYIVFTSNIFAVMGLRALFFLIENILHSFHHLQKGLSFILIFIGAKMMAGIFNLHISSLLSFGIIIGALALSLILSLVFPKKI